MATLDGSRQAFAQPIEVESLFEMCESRSPEGLTPIGEDQGGDGEHDLALLVAALRGAGQEAAVGARGAALS